MTTFASNTSLGSGDVGTAFIGSTRTWTGGRVAPAGAVTFNPATVYQTGDVVRYPNNFTYWTRNNISYTVTPQGVPNPPNEFNDEFFNPHISLYDDTEVFHPLTGATVSANDSVIVCTYLGSNTGSDVRGTLDFDNVVIQANNGTEASSAHNWTFNNVTYIDNTLTSTVNIGKYGGTLNNTTNYQVNGFNAYGNVDSTDPTLGFLVFFPAFDGITSNSVLNNVSLWNGETDADKILGSSLTFSYNVFSGLRSGPIGFRPFYDTSTITTTTRALFRCAFGPANSNGLSGQLLSYDFRSIHGSSGQWRFSFDNAGRLNLINPLSGDPTGRLSWACGALSGGSSFSTYIGHVPSIAGDVIFSSNSTDPFVTFPATITNATTPTPFPSGILNQTSGVTSPAVDGIGFQTQTGTLANGTQASYAAGADSTSNIEFEVPTTQTYNIYSWQNTAWAQEVSITPTAPGLPTAAHDLLVEADRASGLYPAVDADGFATEFNIAVTADPLTSKYPTIATATAAFIGSAATYVRDGLDVASVIKLAHYIEEQSAQTTVGLPYSYAGTTLTINTPVDFAVITALPSTSASSAITRVIASRSLNLDDSESVTTIVANGITVSDIINTTTPKVNLSSTAGITLRGTANTIVATTTDSSGTINFTSLLNSTITGGTAVSSVTSSVTGSTVNSDLTMSGVATVTNSVLSGTTNDFSLTSAHPTLSGNTISGDLIFRNTTGSLTITGGTLSGSLNAIGFGADTSTGSLILDGVDASGLTMSTVTGTRSIILSNGAVAPVPALLNGWTVSGAPRTFGIQNANGGWFYHKELGSTGEVIPRRIESTDTNTDALISTDTGDDTTYAVWWKRDSSAPTSTVSNIYDYAYTTWNPSTAASGVIDDFQPDPGNVLATDANQESTVSVSAADDLNSDGEAVFTIAGSYSAVQSQTVAWLLANTSLYLEAVVTSDLTGTTRAIGFGLQSTVRFAQGIIRFNANLVQRQLGGVDMLGFLSTPLLDNSGVEVGVPSVIVSSIIAVQGTLIQITEALDSSEVANGVGFLVQNRLGNKGVAPYQNDPNEPDYVNHRPKL